MQASSHTSVLSVCSLVLKIKALVSIGTESDHSQQSKKINIAFITLPLMHIQSLNIEDAASIQAGGC